MLDNVSVFKIEGNVTKQLVISINILGRKSKYPFFKSSNKEYIIIIIIISPNNKNPIRSIMLSLNARNYPPVTPSVFTLLGL